MTLSNEHKKHFRNIGHNLKPIVIIAGKGLTEGVYAELERALEDHELIKIKIAIVDRDIRKEVVQEVCAHLNATLIQEIGKVALIYRQSRKENLKNSNVR